MMPRKDNLRQKVLARILSYAREASDAVLVDAGNPLSHRLLRQLRIALARASAALLRRRCWLSSHLCFIGYKWKLVLNNVWNEASLWIFGAIVCVVSDVVRTATSRVAVLKPGQVISGVTVAGSLAAGAGCVTHLDISAETSEHDTFLYRTLLLSRKL